jgi:phosphatidylserine/phosphatidylglycerophosphate/cardiolipin synthase-like enzyme
MRKRKQSDGITVNAIAGTHVVFLGLDLTKKFHKGFKGFAIKRRDHSDGEVTWARGLKTFEETEPNPTIGETFSTFKHPWQGFQWADYSVKPGLKYTYFVVCMYGKPEALEARRELSISITTEREDQGIHTVYFNRGSVATQEYARKFLNQTPEIAGPGAYEWLSRGLVEALIAFIGRAKKGDSLHAAVYEFQWGIVLNAFKSAKDRGVNVKIIYDNVEEFDKDGKPTGPWQRNREEITKAKLDNCCTGRANARLMHNKFIVLSKGKKPTSVWTGSTNLTQNGIYGHSNLGHIVEDKAIAKGFIEYWERLEQDLEVGSEYRNLNIAAFEIPAALDKGTSAVYSPRGTNLDILDWYSTIAGAANDALLMTFAFGMHEKFKEVFRKEDQVLRMSLMEKAYASPVVKERDEEDIQKIRNLPNVVVALGNRIVTNAFDRWLKEMYSVDGAGKHVYWIHTKYMIVDPLSADPIVVSGSANFSKASSDSNDENMLVIKGDKRIADIYFGEYMRLYSHYAFRESVKRAHDKKKAGTPVTWKPQFLDAGAGWTKDYFNKKDTSGRFVRRQYFAGLMAV